MSLSSTYLSRKALIADNLQAMGVLSADADDGLTTLANRILDIEPSISGLELDTSVSIHSSDTTCLIGQSIMFWAELKADYDDETATDVDLSGVLTGATVTFKNGNTVLGTAVTDSDGIAYYTHTFATAGVFNIVASFAGTDNFDACVSSGISVSVTYRIDIVADKSILSFEDQDVAMITATLSDGSGGVVGETLSYEILDKDDNVLDSGSDVTDVSGEVGFSYVAAGVGDVQVIVYYGVLLQEIYAIEDCYDYDLTTYTSNHTYNISLPSRFKLEYEIYYVNGGATYTVIGDSASKGMLCGKVVSSANTTYIIARNSGDVTLQSTTPTTNNVWTPIAITYDGTNFNYNNEVTTSNLNGITLNNFVNVVFNYSSGWKIRNVKVKAL